MVMTGIYCLYPLKKIIIIRIVLHLYMIWIISYIYKLLSHSKLNIEICDYFNCYLLSFFPEKKLSCIIIPYDGRVIF